MRPHIWLRDRYTLIAAFLLIAISRLYLWGSEITRFQQDESNWFYDFKTKGLGEYLLIPDAGYPVPALRLVSWCLFSLTDSPITFHCVLIVIITCCLVSPFVQNVHESLPSVRLGVVIALSAFADFSLLLFHNLPYLLAIPLITLLTDSPTNSAKRNLAIVLLTLLAAKPQILLLVLFVIFYRLVMDPGFKMQSLKRTLLWLPTIVLAVMLLVLGRLSDSSITFDLGTLLSPMTIVMPPFIFVSQVIPIVPFVLSALVYFGLSDYRLVAILMWGAMLGVVGIWGIFIYKSESRLRVIGFTFLTTLPLLLFPNSGWSTWRPTSFGFYPLIHQRHDFFVLLIFLLGCLPQIKTSIFQNKVSANLLVGALLGVGLQNGFITLVFRFYKIW